MSAVELVVSLRLWVGEVDAEKLAQRSSVAAWALLNTGMNGRFRNSYKPSIVSFVTSSEKWIHTLIQQRRGVKAKLLD